MKKEAIIWILLVAGSVLSAVVAIAAGLGVMPPVAATAAGIVVVVLAAAFMLCLWRHLKRLDKISRYLDSQAMIVPADFRGTALEEMTDAVRGYAMKVKEQLTCVQEENQGLSLQLQLLRRRKSNVEEIINSIRDSVIVSDDKGRVVLANESAAALFGFTFDPKNLQSLQELLHQPSLLELIQKCQQSKTAHVRHEVMFEDGPQPVSFEVVLSCVTDDVGNVIQVVTVLHDVTREKEIAQAKNDFVSHVSHELKTPLASINAYAEMLVDGEAEDEETLAQFCEVIQSQAQRLGRLIEDILNISRIESGLIKVQKETHSLALVIRDSVEMIKSYAQEKSISIDAPAPILYDQVYIDRDMISQVAINLLSNAVKYTPAGGHITIQSELNEADGQVTVTVADTGVGIPAEDVDHVFDKFYRVEANNKYAKGTGLGLNLVKQIVETVHDGDIFVTSTQNEGSTFGFTLPLSVEAVPQTVS
ncbi:MAG: ATP-binding protein [Planctomycetota bacterium]|jgi:two-component system phosphate regulon sensor histidine kinase PhoR